MSEYFSDCAMFKANQTVLLEKEGGGSRKDRDGDATLHSNLMERGQMRGWGISKNFGGRNEFLCRKKRSPENSPTFSPLSTIYLKNKWTLRVDDSEQSEFSNVPKFVMELAKIWRLKRVYVGKKRMRRGSEAKGKEKGKLDGSDVKIIISY